MNGHGQSDRSVVPANPPNKAAAAEAGGGRGRAKGSTAGKTRPGHSAGPGASRGLDGVREGAQGEKAGRVTGRGRQARLRRLGRGRGGGGGGVRGGGGGVGRGGGGGRGVVAGMDGLARGPRRASSWADSIQ